MTAMPTTAGTWDQQLQTPPMPGPEQFAGRAPDPNDPLGSLFSQLEQSNPGLTADIDNQAQHQAANQWLRQQTENIVDQSAGERDSDNAAVQRVQQAWGTLAAQAQQAFPRVDQTQLAQHYQENARVAVQQARLARQMNQPYSFFRNASEPEAGLDSPLMAAANVLSNQALGFPRRINNFLGPQGRDVAQYVGTRLPFVAPAFSINETWGAVEAAQRIQTGEATPSDYNRLADWQRRREAASQHGLVRQAADLATAIPAFGVELALTGGTYTAGRNLVTRGATRLATQAGERMAGRVVLRHAATQAAGALTGVAAQTAANPGRVADAYSNIQANRIRQNERGEFVIDPQSAFDVPRAFGQAYIEQLTERLGGNFGRIARGAGQLTGTTPLMRSLSTRIAASGLANRWIQSGANRTLSGFTQAISNPTGRLAVAREFMQGLTSRMGLNRLARQTQFSGLFGEMMEERVGDVLKGFLDLSFQERPDFGAMGDAFDWIGSGFRNKRAGNAFLRQLAAEGMGFMAYGGAMRVAEGMRRGAGQAMRGDTQQPTPTPTPGTPTPTQQQAQPFFPPNLRSAQARPVVATRQEADAVHQQTLAILRQAGLPAASIQQYEQNYADTLRNGSFDEAAQYSTAERNLVQPVQAQPVQAQPMANYGPYGPDGDPVQQQPQQPVQPPQQPAAAPPGMPVPASAPVQPAPTPQAAPQVQPPTQQGSVQTPSWRATRYDVQTPVQTQAPADPGLMVQNAPSGQAQEQLTPQMQPLADVPDTTGVFFETEQGSAYVVHPDGGTTRNKMQRIAHGADAGVKERSKRTVYVTPEQANELGLIYAQGVKTELVFDTETQRIGVRYRDGKDKGKIEGRTVSTFTTEPAIGLAPVEVWDKGGSHIGNPITKIVRAQPQQPQPAGPGIVPASQPNQMPAPASAPVQPAPTQQGSVQTPSWRATRYDVQTPVQTQAPADPVQQPQPAPVQPPVAPTPAAPVQTQQAASQVGSGSPWKGERPEYGVAYNAPTPALNADPARFQYKLNTNAEGVTEELKGVKTFNPDFAGTISVWQDPKDGKTYVVNGHHRYELARRTGHPTMSVRYIQAATAEEARATGAAINIAEGRGTAIDGAKFMRDSGLTPEDMARMGISLKGKVAADATVLTRLNDRLFSRVARGLMKENEALAIGRYLSNHDRQDQLVGILERIQAKGKTVGPTVIEEMAMEMAATPTVTQMEDGGLFGDFESEKSVFLERAEIKSYVRAELAKQANDFLAVSNARRAGNIEKAGNKINVEDNQKIAKDLERVKNVYDTLVNRKGPISDAINQAAIEYAAASGKKKRDAIKAGAVDAVRNAVFSEAGLGAEGQDTPGGSTVRPPQPSQPTPAATDAGRGAPAAPGVMPAAPQATAAPPPAPAPAPPPAPAPAPASVQPAKPQASKYSHPLIDQAVQQYEVLYDELDRSDGYDFDRDKFRELSLTLEQMARVAMGVKADQDEGVPNKKQEAKLRAMMAEAAKAIGIDIDESMDSDAIELAIEDSLLDEVNSVDDLVADAPIAAEEAPVQPRVEGREMVGDVRPYTKAQSDYRARFKTEKGRLEKSEGMEEKLNLTDMIADLGGIDLIELTNALGSAKAVRALRAAGLGKLIANVNVLGYVDPKGKARSGASMRKMAERLVEKAGFIIPEGMTPTDWLLGAIRSDVARRVSETSELAAEAGKELEAYRQQLINVPERVERREGFLAKLNADRAARGKPALKLEAGEKAKPKAKKTDAASVMNAVLNQATRIPDPAVTFDTIQEATAGLDALTIAQLKELAGKMGITLAATAKAEMAWEITNDLLERKTAQEDVVTPAPKPRAKTFASVADRVMDQVNRMSDPSVTGETILGATSFLNSMTVPQLKALAKSAAIRLEAKKKAEIIWEIREKLIQRKDEYEQPGSAGNPSRDAVDQAVERSLQDGEAAGQAEEFAEDAGFIGQAPKTVSAQQLVLDLSDLFGIKITVKKIPPTKDKQGNIVAQSRGRFGVATGEIIMDPMHVGSFSTLAHELGHWIATGLEVWPRSYQSLPADIQRGFISMDYKPNRGDPAKSAYEGFAEYIRYRLLGDLGRYTTADQEAAIAWANEEILKRKDLESKLTQAQLYIYARTSLSAVDQNDLSVTGKAEMSNGILTLGQRLRRLITEGWRWFYNVAYTGGIFDEIQPIIEKAMGKLTMGLKDLRLSISYQTPGFYDRMINKGVFAWMGSYYKTIGPSFAQMEQHVQGTAFDKELLNGAREWEAFVMSKYILDEQAKRVALRATGKKGVQDVVGPETLAKWEAIYNNLVYDTELVRAAEKTHALYTQGFNAILKAKLAMGWISQADYDAMMAAHPNYLSLTRVMLGHEDDNVLQEQGQVTNPLLPRTGSDAQIIAPSLAYAIEVQKFAVMMARAQANRPIFDAVRFREQRPGEDYARGAMLGSYIVETDAPIDVTTISREDILKALIKSGVNKQMAKLTVNAMKADELLFFRQAPWDESGKNIVVEMVNGVKKFYEVKDRYLYEELTGQAGASSGLVQAIRLIADFPLMQRYTKAVKFGAATTSIGFQFKNILRDVETFIENSEKMSALASKDAVLAYARMYAWYGRMITGDGKANQAYLTPDGKGVILENIYMEAGGQNMRAVAYDPPAAVDKLRGKKSKLDRFKAVVETMGAAEQAPRFIEYTSSLRSQGYDEARIHKNLLAQPDVYPVPVDVQNNAILAAARVTSPHSNVGPLFKELNKINPFMGASMAGIANEMRNWVKNPWRAARALAIFTGLEMAYWWWSHKEPWFKELEPWQRNAYWYFQWGPGFLRIPRPRGTYGLLPALGQDQMRRMFDENPNFGGWFDQAVAEYSHPLIPEPGNTLWQIQGNQDWRGAPIVPPNVQRTGSTLEQRGYQARYALDRALGGIPTRGGQAIRAWRESESVLGGVGGGILSQIPLYHLGQPSASLTQLYARDREITQQALRATQNGQPAFQPNEEQHRIQQAAQAVAALNAYMAGRNTRHRLAQRDIYGNSSTAEQIVEGLPRMTATQRASLGELRLRLAQYGLQGGQPPDLSAIASPQMRQAMQQMLNRRQRGQSRPALRMG